VRILPGHLLQDTFDLNGGLRVFRARVMRA
jgi:hypothetical protein